MTEIEVYLQDVLSGFSPYIINDSDTKTIGRDLAEFIFQKVSIKRFRKQKLQPETAKDIRQKISLCIKNNQPIKFILLFGGYKHFWNPSSPEIDWAEVFSLKFMAEWLAPISAVYKPGAVIELVSEDWVLQEMDNYSQESLDIYSKSLVDIINVINNSLPDNLKFAYSRLSDKFDKSEMIRLINDRIEDGYKRWDSLSQEEKDVELKRSSRSVLLRQDEGLDKLIESRIIELAYYDVEALPQLLNNYSDKDKIYFCMSFGLSGDNIDHWLTLGSTYASVVDFWVGRGVLEDKKDKSYTRRIVSKEQYDKIKGNLSLERVSIIDSSFKNLQSIEVINSIDWQNMNIGGSNKDNSK